MEYPLTLAHLLFGEVELGEGYFYPGFDPIPVFYTSIVALILVAGVVSFQIQLRRAKEPLVPSSKFDLLNFFEILVEVFSNFIRDLLGKDWKRYVPILLSLWVVILFSNFLGLVPYFEPPTSNFNTNVSMAIVVFFATQYYGFRAHGIKYLKQFVGPIPWLAPLMIPIELIGHLARVLSLSVRLLGNMFADHMVISIFLMLVAPFVPLAFMALGVLVSLVQAFIFSILSVTYFSIAVSEEH